MPCPTAKNRVFCIHLDTDGKELLGTKYPLKGFPSTLKNAQPAGLRFLFYHINMLFLATRPGTSFASMGWQVAFNNNLTRRR